jgi:CO/xanthine dehydrogenase FAD-binding subunit
MIPAPFDYHRPGSLDEAIGLLARYGDDARVLSGGMSLLPTLKLRLGAFGHLVDIGRIPGLEYIREEGGMLRIGAGIALTNAGPTPVEAVEASKFLAGRTLDEKAIAEASRLAAEAGKPTGDRRGSVEYKREMARVLAGRALRAALERAKGN